MASKVYYADLRTDHRENLQQKLSRLMHTAGMGNIDFDRKYVAIKMHFGEPGNLAFLRPYWARTVADFVKERGGKQIKLLCIIGAPEGIKRLREAHPDVQIYCGHVDRELNANAYICPGLGDAGDRIFGTK